MRGMKQIELATLSGISKYSISHYLKGDWEGKQDAVYELARVLDVSEAWLMGYDVPPERKTVAKGAPAIPPGFLPCVVSGGANLCNSKTYHIAAHPNRYGR